MLIFNTQYCIIAEVRNIINCGGREGGKEGGEFKRCGKGGAQVECHLLPAVA
jgi:hypothetical protein